MTPQQDSTWLVSSPPLNTSTSGELSTEISSLKTFFLVCQFFKLTSFYCSMSRPGGLCQDGGLWFLQAARPGKQDLDILRHTRVCGAGDHSQQSILDKYFPFYVNLTQGHDRAVDFWSLGILTYELMTGTWVLFRYDNFLLKQFVKNIITGLLSLPLTLWRFTILFLEDLINLTFLDTLTGGIYCCLILILDHPSHLDL